MPTSNGPAAPATFSVILPTYGRPDALRRCLLSLAQDHGGRTRPLEVLVVDDIGTGDVREIVDSFVGRLNVRYLVGPGRYGAAASRNSGLAAAAGTHVVFLDDDCLVEPGWLDAYAHAVASTWSNGGKILFGGASRNAFPANAWAVASQHLIDFLMRWFDTPGRQPAFFPSNNIVAAIGPLRDVGGFDPWFPRAGAEDRELSERCLAAGWCLVPVPGAVVMHENRTTARGFWLQHYGYGRGAAFLEAVRAARHGPPIRLESFAFYRTMIFSAFRASTVSWHKVAVPVLTVISQVAYAAGYYLQRARGTGIRREGAPGPRHTPVDVAVVADDSQNT